MLHIPSEAVLERKLALSVEPEEKASSLASQPLLRARQEDQSGLVVSQAPTVENHGSACYDREQQRGHLLVGQAWLDSGCK